MAKDKILAGQATPEQIAAWKKEHGDVFVFKTDESVCYLKKPDRKIIGAYSALQNTPIRANEYLLANCWLGGDETFKTNDEMFLGVAGKLTELVIVKDVEVEKL